MVLWQPRPFAAVTVALFLLCISASGQNLGSWRDRVRRTADRVKDVVKPTEKPPERGADRPPSPTAPPATPPSQPRALTPAVSQGFDGAPEPSFEALLRHVLATHGDFYRDDPRMETLAYLYLVLPPGGSPECQKLFNSQNDEFSKRRRSAEVRDKYQQLIREAPSWPKTGTYRLWTLQRLGEYDFSRKAFRLSNAMTLSFLPDRGQPVEFPIAHQKLAAPNEYGGLNRAGRDWCNTNDMDLNRLNMSSRGTEIILQVEGTGDYAELPMDPAQAEAFRRRLQGSEDRENVVLEILVDVAAPQIAPRSGAPGIKTPTFRAITKAARLFRRDTREVLHVFPGRGNLNPTAAPMETRSMTDSRLGLPLTPHRLNLLALRHRPEVLTPENLTSLTFHQLAVEIEAWRALDATHSRGRPIQTSPAKFYFEWEKLITTQPELANGPVLDLFLDPAADWSFVQRQPGWDERTNDNARSVEVFIFARDRIANRNPEFLAREMTAVFKSHIDAAVKKTASRLHMTITLPGTGYDFSANALRFLKPGTGRDYNGRYEFTNDSGPLLDPKQEVPNWPVLAGEKGRHVYWMGRSRHKVHRDRSEEEAQKSSDPRVRGYRLHSYQPPPAAWRSQFVGSSAGAWPFELFGFDRELKIRSIPLPPAKAEQIADQGLSARVVFTVQNVELGTAPPQSRGEPPSKLALYLCHLESIEILTHQGEVIATIPI